MNVPHLSHMGGFWKHLICKVCDVLETLLSAESQLDDEALRIFITKAEYIVNSRPLTVVNLND